MGTYLLNLYWNEKNYNFFLCIYQTLQFNFVVHLFLIFVKKQSQERMRVNPDRNIFSINVELTSTFLLYRGLVHHHHRVFKLNSFVRVVKLKELKFSEIIIDKATEKFCLKTLPNYEIFKNYLGPDHCRNYSFSERKNKLINSFYS